MRFFLVLTLLLLVFWSGACVGQPDDEYKTSASRTTVTTLGPQKPPPTCEEQTKYVNTGDVVRYLPKDSAGNLYLLNLTTSMSFYSNSSTGPLVKAYLQVDGGDGPDQRMLEVVADQGTEGKIGRLDCSLPVAVIAVNIFPGMYCNYNRNMTTPKGARVSAVLKDMKILFCPDAY